MTGTGEGGSGPPEDDGELRRTSDEGEGSRGAAVAEPAHERTDGPSPDAPQAATGTSSEADDERSQAADAEGSGSAGGNASGSGGPDAQQAFRAVAETLRSRVESVQRAGGSEPGDETGESHPGEEERSAQGAETVARLVDAFGRFASVIQDANARKRSEDAPEDASQDGHTPRGQGSTSEDPSERLRREIFGAMDRASPGSRTGGSRTGGSRTGDDPKADSAGARSRGGPRQRTRPGRRPDRRGAARGERSASPGPHNAGTSGSKAHEKATEPGRRRRPRIERPRRQPTEFERRLAESLQGSLQGYLARHATKPDPDGRMRVQLDGDFLRQHGRPLLGELLGALSKAISPETEGRTGGAARGGASADDDPTDAPGQQAGGEPSRASDRTEGFAEHEGGDAPKVELNLDLGGLLGSLLGGSKPSRTRPSRSDEGTDAPEGEAAPTRDGADAQATGAEAPEGTTPGGDEDNDAPRS